MENGLPPKHCPEAGAAAAAPEVTRLRKKEELLLPVVTSSAKGLSEVSVASVAVALVDSGDSSIEATVLYGLEATQSLR